MLGSTRRLGVVLVLVEVIGLAGVGSLLSSDGRTTAGVSDPEALRSVVLQAAPVGGPIEQAQRFLEDEGFKLGMVTKPGEIGYTRSDGGPISLHWNFLWITLTQQDDRLMDVRAKIEQAD